jgi:hypothetical protein
MRGSDDYDNRRPRPSDRKPESRLSRFDNLNPNSAKKPNSRNIPPSLFAAYGDADQDADELDARQSRSADDPDLYLDPNSDLDSDSGSGSYRGSSSYSDKPTYGRPLKGNRNSSRYGSGEPIKRGKGKLANDDEKKAKTKKLRELVGNQAVCLVIIFALIAAFNWMSADYSGEYIAQDKNLGLVKLSLVRRALTVEGELYYKNTPSMTMEQGKQPKDMQVDLAFVNTNKNFMRPGSINRARFIGTIDGSLAEGAIVDARGSHNVKLTKNIVASLFKQLQAHIPNFDVPPPPSLFHAPEQELQPTPGQARFATSSGKSVGIGIGKGSGNGSSNSNGTNAAQPRPFSMTSPFKGWGGQN